MIWFRKDYSNEIFWNSFVLLLWKFLQKYLQNANLKMQLFYIKIVDCNIYISNTLKYTDWKIQLLELFLYAEDFDSCTHCCFNFYIEFEQMLNGSFHIRDAFWSTKMGFVKINVLCSLFERTVTNYWTWFLMGNKSLWYLYCKVFPKAI